MRIKLFSEMINRELSFIMFRALILDGIIYLITLPVYKFSAEIPAGLIAGTLVMLFNFILLGMSAERAVERPAGAAKRYMFFSYIIRFCIMGAMFTACIKLSWINLFAAVLPQFYPKIIYTVHTVYMNKKGGNS